MVISNIKVLQVTHIKYALLFVLHCSEELKHLYHKCERMKPIPHQVHVAKYQKALLKQAKRHSHQTGNAEFPAEIEGMSLMKVSWFWFVFC